MELTYDEIKQAVKEGIIEGFKEARSKKVKRNDPDLITTNEAFEYVTKARFYELLKISPLEREKKGTAQNSPKYVSKKKLLKYNNEYP